MKGLGVWLIALAVNALLMVQTSPAQSPVSPLRTAPSAKPIMVRESGETTHVAPTQVGHSRDEDGSAPAEAEGTADEGNAASKAPANTAPELNFEILIGPGDLIEVSVYGAPDYVKDVRVRSTGEITLPMAGTLMVAGLTPAQAEELIAKRLREGEYFTDPRVSVIEKETVTQGVSVLGEVQKPGVYSLPGPRKLFDAISAAGGTTPRAGNTVSIMHRTSSQSTIVALAYGRSSIQSNVSVYPGDTIVVSKAGVVYVVGDVRMPGGFVMENSHMTILEAYAMAQGANSTAALDRAELIRKAGSDAQVISLKKILTARAPDMNLQPDDILFIPQSGAKVAGRRTLEAIVQTASGIAIYSRVP